MVLRNYYKQRRLDRLQSKSKAAGHQKGIENLTSLPFFLLLIEVILVTLYFGIAISIEVNNDREFQASAGNRKTIYTA